MNLSKTDYGFLLVASLSLVLSLCYIPAYNVLCGDKEVYRYVGRVILEGGVPYRDVFDHKPPLIFFLNYLVLGLGGDWAQWTIDTLLVLAVSGLFFQLGRRYRLAFPWLLPVLFNFMIRDYVMCLGMGMTREYTAVFFLAFFCVLMGKHRYRYYFLGVLSGLIFFMQQDQVLALIPLFVYSILPQEDAAPVGARILRIATGFLMVALPVVLYFAWHGALAYFWQDAFLFNLGWYTTTLKESFGDHLRKMKLVLDEGWYEVAFMAATILGVCSLFFRNRNKRLVLACLAAVALSVIPEFLGGRDVVSNASQLTFTHYYLPLSASLCILLFVVFAFAEEPVLRGWKAQAIYGVLILTSLSYSALRYGTHLPLLRKDPDLDVPELNYLREHRPQDRQLFVFGNTNLVYAYNMLGITGPSKWVYQHFYFLYDNWDGDHAILRSVMGDLLRYRTVYVLDYSTSPYNSYRDPEVLSLWRAFLAEHYQQVAMPGGGGSRLWKINN
jgi:hypothetical protein